MRSSVLVLLALLVAGCSSKGILGHHYTGADLQVSYARHDAERFDSASSSGWPPVDTVVSYDRSEESIRAGVVLHFDYRKPGKKD